MKLYYNGVDIYGDVSVSACHHYMYCERQSDKLKIVLNDTRNLWDGWSPQKGDTIRAKDGMADTGEMTVSAVNPLSGQFEIVAHSIPLDAHEKVSKAWEDVRLLQLAEEKAQNHGLELKTYGVEDQTYSYVSQNNEDDFAFLYKRFLLEGLAFIVFDGKMILYSESYMEQKTPKNTMTITRGYDYRYKDQAENAFGSCKVFNGGISGSYSIGDGKEFPVLLPFQISSEGEANRFAQNLLRSRNKDMTTATINTDYMARELAPGSLVNLVTDGVNSWDGTAFVTEVRHDYVFTKSKVCVRKVLEGY